jgi:quinol monooxygenase YgiN
MPPLPWTATAADSGPDPGEILVMASLLRLNSFRRVPGFLRAAMAIRRQILRTDGAIGVSLNTALPRTFYTLSAWRDRGALEAFVRSEPHVSSMRRYHRVMADARFVSWITTPDALPPTWTEAQHRLRQATPKPQLEQVNNERVGTEAM